MTTTSRTPEEEAARAERAQMELRRALKRLARETSGAGVKAALALTQWEELDVPNKVLETIDDMDKQETLSGRETADNQ